MPIRLLSDLSAKFPVAGAFCRAIDFLLLLSIR